jgi:hypothetical protein
MYYDGATANKTGTVGFLTSLAGFDVQNGENVIRSGSQQLSLYTVSGTDRNKSSNTTVVAMYPVLNPSLNPKPIIAIHSLNICFASGTTNQSGMMTIGDNTNSGSGLAVSMEIRNGKSC